VTPPLRTQFDPEISHQLERLAARAWPADEVHEVEGWLLRRTDGVDRRRSNSLLPPAGPAHAARTVDLALATAEELDIASVIQVSPAEGHLRLDDDLDARGATVSGRSLVLAGPLSDAAADLGRADRGGGLQSEDRASGLPGDSDLASAGGPGGRPRADVVLSALTAEWVGAWAAVSGIDGTEATAELVLSQLGDRARFATAVDPMVGGPVAVGIGVVEEGWLGLFSLATSPTARRRGVASAVVDALSRWAASRGATRAYLQVEADNIPALTLYAARGFHVAHSYHYRTL
jgi:GNAT superfamily N-acetyltransferase